MLRRISSFKINNRISKLFTIKEYFSAGCREWIIKQKKSELKRKMIV